MQDTAMLGIAMLSGNKQNLFYAKYCYATISVGLFACVAKKHTINLLFKAAR